MAEGLWCLCYHPTLDMKGIKRNLQCQRRWMSVWRVCVVDVKVSKVMHNLCNMHALDRVHFCQCRITMPTKACIGPAASLYWERFDLPQHYGISVLTFNGSRGSEGTLIKQQSSHFDPLWYTTQGMLIYPPPPPVLIPCTRTAIITQHKKEQMTYICIMFLTNKIENTE